MNKSGTPISLTRNHSHAAMIMLDVSGLKFSVVHTESPDDFLLKKDDFL